MEPTQASERLTSGHRLSHPPPGDEVLITGVSGYFPDSDSVIQLQENLFNKVDLITPDHQRWRPDPEIPHPMGKINKVNKFDASFFGIQSKQAQLMDPMGRMLMEKTFEALFDAGVNPKEIRNTNCGVFIGSCITESEKSLFYERENLHKYGILGCARAILANRISYWLGVTGPSYHIDSACSSSLHALEHAYKAIRDGHCDSAIVGGSSLCLHPHITLLLAKLGVLSPDGRCKTFDSSANGYVRAEAIVVIFLQKAKHSRRAYMQIVHAKTNCDGYKEQGITYPSSSIQKQLLAEFYEECSVLPQKVDFVEAHGTGTVAGDREELSAIDQIFCSGRSGPLKIGSIKSNLGHAEPVSGLVSIAKMCIAYMTGYIAPNLHFVTPSREIPALLENRFEVVTDKTPWNKGLSAINNFGFGGANAHVLLRNFAKIKVNNSVPTDNLPRLVCLSGRTESAITKIIENLLSHTVDVEQVRLLHAIHDENIHGHLYRGYLLMGSNPEKAVLLSRSVQYFSGERRPVCFLYTGMGSQWPGMGVQLMTIPIFAAAIQKCHKVLEPKGINLSAIITDPDPKVYDDVINAFIGITAVQIGLTDVLKSLGIEPDYIIGLSLGEHCSAYADGCLTAEQTILSAYCRGLACHETPIIKGAVAAVNIGYNKIKCMCPPDIDVSTRINPDASTVAGPAESIKNFVTQLSAQNFFAREGRVCNIPFHSRYLKDAGPTLVKQLKEVIPEPKLRSKKWLSTSVPQHQWESPGSSLSSAEYFTNNFLNTVLFEETSHMIPHNAITIEIAPYPTLLGFLKRALKKNDNIYISLTQKNKNADLQVFFNALGKLYEAGLNPHLANLYPHVEFPVSQGTPMLSHLVEWDHSEDWPVMSNGSRAQENKNCEERIIKMSVNDEENSFITTRVIGGDNLYPEAGYLILVWETYAIMLGQKYANLSVVFENVRFNKSTVIPKDGNLEFVVVIQKGSRNFEVMENGCNVASGLIYAKNNMTEEYHNLPKADLNDPFTKNMLTKDFYQELRLRRYEYGAPFHGIQECNVQFTHGNIFWINNWVTFIDSLFQLNIISTDTRGILLPTRIKKLSIDTAMHFMHYSAISETKSDRTPAIDVTVDRDVDITRAGGVELRGCHLTPFAKSVHFDSPVLEKHEFIPFFGNDIMAIKDILRVDIQIIVENLLTFQVKTIELADQEYKTNGHKPLLEIVGQIIADMNFVNAELVLISEEAIKIPPHITVKTKGLSGESNAVLFIGANLLNRPNVLQEAEATLRDNSFIISREKDCPDTYKYADKYDIICIHNTGDENLVLFRKKVVAKLPKCIKIQTSDETYAWIDQVKKYQEEGHKLVLYSQDEPINGLLGLVNCLRKEPGGENVCGLLIADPSAPAFNPDLEFYKNQIDKDILSNVYQNGTWGSYRHLLIGNQEMLSTNHAYVESTTVGDTVTLRWLEGPLSDKPGCKNPENALVHVYCAAVNLRDVLTASGHITADAIAGDRLQRDCVQGLEVAGRTSDGSRVMGIVQSHGISNLVEGYKKLLWTIPDQWGFEEAATVPLAYSTIYHALVMVGHLQRGESILIHAGSGGVGQAAINVALHYGCEIFTTVGTAEERDFIKKLFPQLKDNHIGSSLNTTFLDMVKRETKGKGVDIVLNSLIGDKLQKLAGCLTDHGRLLDLRSKSILGFDNNTGLETSCLMPNIAYHSISLDYAQLPTQFKKELQDLVQKGILSGAVRPLTYHTFDKSEVETAFRYIATEQNVGKVIIKIRDEETANGLVKPTSMPISAVPRYFCHEDQVYILVGGLGGFGLELADWLILRGARKIVFVSRRGVSNGYQSYRLRLWTSYGVKLQISTEDVTTEVGCEAMLRTAITMGPVAAIFNLAGVVEVTIFKNQTPETFLTTGRPKTFATLHLDKLSRKMCPELKSFVVFSSVTSGRGYSGQTNYAFANSVMERICEERRKAGLPGLAVQWGAIGDVGMLTNSKVEDIQRVLGDMMEQKIASCLLAFDRFLKQDSVIVSSMVVVKEKKIEEAVARTVVDAIADILRIKDLETVSQRQSLAELGMDSMTAVEIKQTLEKEFEMYLTARDIRRLTFHKLKELSAQK